MGSTLSAPNHTYLTCSLGGTLCRQTFCRPIVFSSKSPGQDAGFLLFIASFGKSLDISNPDKLQTSADKSLQSETFFEMTRRSLRESQRKTWRYRVFSEVKSSVFNRMNLASKYPVGMVMVKRPRKGNAQTAIE